MSSPRSTIFFRNCDKPAVNPIAGKVSGEIPQWIQGTLIRNGPGIQQIGPDHYKHLFDGLSVMHRFHVEDGKATYNSRPLESETYKTNMAAQRIVVYGFGTVGIGDPCETLYGRFKTMFTGGRKEYMDNCNVNVAFYGDQLYAMTETAFVHRVDPVTLAATGNKIPLTDYITINRATAHPHILEDGTVLNMGNNYRHKKGPHYCIIKVPASYESSETAFKEAKIIAEIPCRWKMYPCYFHSFGMTTDKIIFIEQPYCLSVPKMITRLPFKKAIRSSFTWYPNEKTRIHVVSMKDGEIHPIVYETDNLFTFHHANAYEEDGQIVVDVSAYRSGQFISDGIDVDKMYVPNSGGDIKYAVLKRYVLPLEVPKDAPKGENLVRIPGCKATATFRKDNIVDVTAQEIAPGFHEFPRINYHYNGKKYNYVYGVTRTQENIGSCLPDPDTVTKINVHTGKVMSWHSKGVLASEPVFVPNKTLENPAEDDGVVLVALLHENDTKKMSLLILDAKTMKEVGKAEFNTEGNVPSTFHGQWAHDGDKVHLY